MNDIISPRECVPLYVSLFNLKPVLIARRGSWTRPFFSYSLAILSEKPDCFLNGIFRYLLLDAILSDSSFLKASFLISDAILLSIKIGGLEFT